MSGDILLRWIILISVMAASTYLVRMVPFVAFRKKIKSRFVKSMIYYLPYGILTAMTVPGIFYVTGSIYTALAGFIVALVLALCNRSLLTISLSASGASLIVWIVMTYLIK